MRTIKSLFRIGPGPSSSHTMGPLYAVKDYLHKNPNTKKLKVNLYGSLALTGKGHFTDVIIKQTAKNIETDIVFDVLKKDIAHPNTLDITGFDSDENKFETITYYSIGGGTIAINDINAVDEQKKYSLNSLTEIIDYCKQKKYTLSDYCIESEDDDFIDFMNNIFDVMIESVENGLSNDGLLPGDLKVYRRAKNLYDNIVNGQCNNDRSLLISAYAIAVSETNASMGTIVTAPTCGAAGIIPSICYYFYKNLKYTKNQIVKGLITSGLIGNLIKHNAMISGAQGGCQAEIGSATSMGSAMITQLFNGDLDMIEKSASTALQHCLGLTCDPVGGYVIFPCIERNAIYANHAYDSSLINLNGINDKSKKIDFDIVVQTLKSTGLDMKPGYKETSLEGLAKFYK